MLSCFTHFFVQDPESKTLLENIGYTHVTITGDTRFDRVIEIAEKHEAFPLIEQFIAGQKTIIAGSTWREDDLVLQKAYGIIGDPSLKLIIAPHELEEKNLSDLEKLFPNSIRYSRLTTNDSRPDSYREMTCLIIDNIGMLSRLYKYGYITYVGGGMTSYGVHNVLEAAVYNKPVLLGPYYEKYIEAVGLVNCGGAIVIKDERELAGAITALLKNTDQHKISANASGSYVRQNAGADKKILQFIQEKRLLIN